MNELFALLDANGLSISFSRMPDGEAPWFAMITDLRYETASGMAMSIAEMGATQEQACQKCMASIRSHDCFKVLRDHVERRVPLEASNG